MPAPAAPKLEKTEDGSYRISGLEAFRSGNYGDKGTFTASDLSAIAESYTATIHEAPVTLDHKQEGPAFGWVESVRAEGDRLFVDLVRVPEEFADAIKSGAYRKRSVEIYTDLEGAPGPYLKAVSFLGAAAPHVKGMTDIAFSHKGNAVSVEFVEAGEGPAVTTFARPAGAESGVIRFSAVAVEILGHGHKVALDEARNGWTDAVKCGAETHQHVVVNGKVQAFTDSAGVAHTHELSGLPDMATFACDKNKETQMSDPTTNTPAIEKPATMSAAPPVTKMEDDPMAAELAALKAELAALKAENASLKAEREEAVEMSETAKFNEAFNKALNEGKVLPAEKDTLFAVFKSTPRANVVKFGEKETSVRTALLDSLAARPSLNLTKPLTSPQFSSGKDDPSADPQAAKFNEAKRVNDYISEQATKGRIINFAEACRELKIKG